MRRLLGLFSAAIGMITLPLGAQPQASMHIEVSAMQAIEGWGFGMAPLDDSGLSELQSAAALRRLVADTGANVVRLPVADNFTKTETVRPADLDPGLRAAASVIADARCTYVVAMQTPPRAFRRYFSNAGDVHFDANPIRVECIPAYASRIASLVACLALQIGYPPAAVSVAARPESNEYCPYEGSVWRKIAGQTAGALFARGLNSPKIVGPDTSLPEAFRRFWGPELDGQQGRQWFGASEVSGGWSSDAASQEHLPHWVCDAAPNGRDSPPNFVAASFARLVSDLAEHRCVVWAFRYAFASAPRPDALYWGDALESGPLAMPVAFLWRHAPVGSHVHRLIWARPGRRLPGIAFESPDHWLVVIPWTGDSPIEIAWTPPSAGNIAMIQFSGDGKVVPVSGHPPHGGRRCVLLPHSVTMLQTPR